jgi:putative ABC transport system permease protein
MNLIALKMLVGDKLKYLSLVAGLSFAALLVTQQASIFNGYARRTGSWIRDTRVADLWVMDSQVEFTEDIKPMLDTSLQRVRGVEGVEWAVPMYKGFVNAILPDGTRRNVRMIGLDDATLTGGPPVMVEGKLSDLRQDRAIIVNADHAADQLKLSRGTEQRPLRVGDRISINDNEAVVVGTFKSSPEFFWEPVLYTTVSRATFMAPHTRRTLMFVLVRVKPDHDVNAVAQRINAVTGLQALTGLQFEAQTMKWILEKTGILVNFGITIALGFVIGVLVSGQTLYTFVLDNLKHFAALKAMGTSNGTIIRMVFIQVLTVGLIGYGLGLGASTITGILFANSKLAFEMTWHIPVIGAFAIVVCCLLAALLSLVRVLKLEPAIVFKG